MSLFRSADSKRVQSDEESLWKDKQDRESYRSASKSPDKDEEKALAEEDAEQDREDAAKLTQIRDDHAKNSYTNFVSVEEEVDLLLRETKVFLDSYAAHSIESWGAATASVVSMEARAKAVQKALGVGSDGKAAPISVLSWLRYGTNRNKLEKKLESARRRSAAIEGELDRY
jgi:anion-transporting  ArsA/GET3 family ATPase